MKKISASILSANFTRLAEEIAALSNAGVDRLHLDIMDGHFVPNLTFGPPVVESIRKITELPLDAHLMITNPDCFIEAFAESGANLIGVHAEACTHLHRSLRAIRNLGLKSCVVLNPHTSLSAIEWVIEEFDRVLLMSVNPGFGGQTLIESALRKSEKLATFREQQGLAFEIEMDGGIKIDNISRVANAGVDVFVVGSELFRDPDYLKTVSSLREKIGEPR